MLGWHISIYRQATDGATPASFGAAHGDRLAVWQTDVQGLRWLDELVERQEAISLGGNGYPFEYTAQSRVLLACLQGDPPEAKAVWTHGPEDIITPAWAGKTTVDQEAVEACRPDEWLLIQAWDES